MNPYENPIPSYGGQPAPPPQVPQSRSELHVQFYDKEVPDRRKSRELGREVTKVVPYVYIRFPGDKHRIVDCRADERTMIHPNSPGIRLNFIERFPEHWRVFEQHREQKIVGTPLDVVKFLELSVVTELKRQGVHTVEQLADVPDRALPNLGMGSRKWRDEARAYLERTQDSAATERLHSENVELNSRIAELEAALQKLQAHGVEAPAPAIEDDGQDLGPGTDFEEWDLDTLRAFLTDAGHDASGWHKKTCVKRARQHVLDQRAEQAQEA